MNLKKINDYKDKLLATVTHDLKTPLNSIITFSNLAKHKINNPEVEENIDNIITNSYLL